MLTCLTLVPRSLGPCALPILQYTGYPTMLSVIFGVFRNAEIDLALKIYTTRVMRLVAKSPQID